MVSNEIDQIREFNRFYTSYLGILNQHFLESPYNLTEVRVLYEINEHPGIRALELNARLALDKGYLSRILKKLFKNGLINKLTAREDKRAYEIALTSKGQEIFDELQGRMNDKLREQLSNFSNWEMEELVSNMTSIIDLLVFPFGSTGRAQKVIIREELKSGDIGYIIFLHGRLYARESGFTTNFENYVIKTFHDFFENYDETKDKIWIAEYNQKIVGCVAIINRSETEGQLRWFLIHPLFRGIGLGKRLLNKAIDYCKSMPYNNVFLMTTNEQQLAVEMYKKVGFQLTSSKKIEMWGACFLEQRYDMKLKSKNE